MMLQTIYIASVSMGKDSLAMLLGLLEKKYPLDIVLFYNTGMEFEAIYHIRDKVKRLVEERGLRFVELHPKESFLYCMLEREVRNRDGSGVHYGYSWCGGNCRWATRHKIDAIRQFKASLGSVNVIDYVGIAADEAEKRAEKEKRPDKVFPLIEWGWTEAYCLNYCRSNGWQWLEETPRTASGFIDLYHILKRVSCFCCRDKNLSELRNIWYYLPQYWEKLKAMQAATSRPYKGYYNGIPKTVDYLESSFENTFELTLEDLLYANS